MGLMDAIQKEVEKTKKTKQTPKWKILKKYEKEIQTMIENDIPIRKQIELILENGILEKLQYREYYDILVRYFNYEKKRKSPRVFRPKKNPGPEVPPTRTKKTIDPVAELSKDVDLLDLA